RAAGPRRLGVRARVELRGLAFDAAGAGLAYVRPDGRLGFLDWATGTTRATACKARHPALDRGGRWVATPSPSWEVVLHDVRADLTRPTEGSEIWSLAWAPDGTRLAVGLSDGGLAVWDLEQVRVRLAEFGLEAPATGHAGAAGTPRAVPGFGRLVRMNRLSG